MKPRLLILTTQFENGPPYGRGSSTQYGVINRQYIPPSDAGSGGAGQPGAARAGASGEADHKPAAADHLKPSALLSIMIIVCFIRNRARKESHKEHGICYLYRK